MTTRIHIVNLGPDAVEVQKSNPNTPPSELLKQAPVILYPSDSYNEYVYDTQSVTVTERKV